jgi:catechol 2,3-dioxygenase-like lactoylglutathione lyase family enzyme
LDHLTIVASDFARSLEVYDAALTAVGFERAVDLEDEEEGDASVEAVAWGVPGDGPTIWLVVGDVGENRVTRGAHIAFRVEDEATVSRLHAAALAAGSTNHSAPRRWPIYRRGEFNAIVVDPDGNLIEAVGPEA